MLSTRDLLALKHALPRSPSEATFRWLPHPPEDMLDDVVLCSSCNLGFGPGCCAAPQDSADNCPTINHHLG
jgi:hypothetical protein